MATRYYTNDEIRTVVTPALAKATTERALRLHAAGSFSQPLKPYLRWGEQNRKITMPAILNDDGRILIGTKDISSVPNNINRGIPRAGGLITLFDPETGAPTAIMECSEVSRRRTAAVARLGLDYLGVDGCSVCILGGGPIGQAVCEDFVTSTKVARILVYDVRGERSRDLAARSNDDRVEVADSLTQALAASDTLVTATTGASGYLTPECVGNKLLIIALSLEDASPELLLAAHKLIVDSFDDCNRENKPIHRLVQRGLLTEEMIYGELGQVIAGLKPGRTCAGEFIYLNPMGMAIEDLSLASAVHELLESRGMGVELPTTY